MYLVSACLLGVNCRYDGGGYHDDKLLELAGQGRVIPVCPEQLGGCGTPRPPCEIYAGSGGDVLDGRCRVISSSGEDKTDNFVRGAMETLKLAKAYGIEKAILKARSPSCGYGRIYDGTFSGKTTEGNGVTAELLIRNGIEVHSDEDFREEQLKPDSR
jgi:uncharacterized protein YbbK (DUF523 family)